MEDRNYIKVLMTADPLGGVWNYALELIKSSEGFPIKFYLATLGGFLNDFQKKEIDALTNVTLLQSNFRLEWMEDCWEEVENSSVWLKELYEEIQPDVVHLNNFSPVLLQSGVPAMVVVHSCVLSWWQAVKGEEAPQEWSKYRSLVGLTLHNATLVVSPSWDMLNSAESIYGNFKNKRVIHNGRDPECFQTSEKEPFILTIGRIWDDAKNISLLAKVAAEISWPVVVIGENTNPSTGCNASFPNIHFTGTLPQVEVSSWLSRAAIYVAPSKYEPFGLAVLEAAMSECALILGDIDTMKELWGEAATTFDVHNSSDLREKLETMIQDKTLREAMAKRAYAHSMRYTSEKMARLYFDTYLGLIALAPQENTVIQKETILNQYI